MKTGTIVAVLAVLVILGAGLWYFMGQTPSMPQGDSLPAAGDMAPVTGDNTTGQGSTTVNVNIDNSTTVGTPSTAAVSLTAGGFSPKSVTIKKGGTVTWSNTGTGDMWVASASHPTHTVYDNTNLQQHCAAGVAEAPFDECGKGNSYSFTFDKAGTWNYHNHSNASQFGTVIVTE